MGTMTAPRRITRDDILSMEEYGKVRSEHRRALIERKRHRRIDVGPFATFYFENFDTMWAQIHEMLWIERGGEAQIADELAAYNPLIPNGRELVATLMFEIDDPVRRARVLAELTGVEDRVELRIGDAVVRAVPELGDGVARTKEDGKTSSIHFLHFPLEAAEVRAFRDPDVQAVLAIEHPRYGHMARLSATVREELAGDLEPA